MPNATKPTAGNTVSAWPFSEVSQSRWDRLSERQKGFVGAAFHLEIEAIERAGNTGQFAKGGKKIDVPYLRLVHGGRPA
jgi:hypothetical protein